MKLLLADDHTLFRDTLVQYIMRAEASAIVVLAKDFHEAMEKLDGDSLQDLVLLDLRMPGMNGLEGLREMRVAYPQLKVAIMSGTAEMHDVTQALELGAVGYFPKTLSGKALIDGIQQVLAGKRYVPMDSRSGRFLPSYYADREDISSSDGAVKTLQFSSGRGLGLTPRESEVLSYLATGDSNKAIANSLGLQEVTVKLHVRGVCQKLGVKNRTQAALKARDLGLVQ